jgi:hypothetical protein
VKGDGWVETPFAPGVKRGFTISFRGGWKTFFHIISLFFVEIK